MTLISRASVRLVLAAAAAVAVGAPALAQGTLQRGPSPVATPVERLGAERLALKPAIGCTPICIKQGCMPELKNNSAAPIASGTPMSFSTKPEGTAKEYPFTLPAAMAPGGTHRVLSAFPEMASCRAWVK